MSSYLAGVSKQNSDSSLVTERARKLRAQYTLQAQSLRNRIDLRINRIPKSLRTANMGELFSKYQENKNKTSKTNPLNINPPSQEDVAEPIVEPISIEAPAERLNNIRTTASNRTRGTKRKRFAYCPNRYPQA